MKTSAVLTVTLVAALQIVGCAVESSDAQRPNRRRPRPAAERPLVPPGPGKHLAFDVGRRDYRRTTRYMLEVTHQSGAVTLHDFKKPELVNRRTIMVPIPALEPGEHKLVIIAEGPGGATRSAAIVYQVKDT